MTAMELQQWKKSFIEDYLNEIDSLEVMSKLEKYAKRIMPNKTACSPCVKTKEQIFADVEEALLDVKYGRFISGEELEKQMETW